MKLFGNKILSSVIVTLSVALVAGVGAVFVNLGRDWFSMLSKPSQFAPAFIFPVVWTIIYLTAIVLLIFLVFKVGLSAKTIAFAVINGVLNILWCLLFFALKQTFLGLVAILLNLIFAFLFALDLYKYKKPFGYIIGIYPVWLCVATALNLAVWILN